MQSSADQLFDLVDDALAFAAKRIRSQVFSIYRDMPWTAEQRKVLLPMIERELDRLVWQVLGLCDNVGCVLPDSADGWSIMDKRSRTDIRVEFEDYVDMWWKHLHDKGRAERLME